MKVHPNFGRAFYVIERDGRTITRTFNTLKVARKMLKLCARNIGAPVIENKNWLREYSFKYGHGGI